MKNVYTLVIVFVMFIMPILALAGQYQQVISGNVNPEIILTTILTRTGTLIPGNTYYWAGDDVSVKAEQGPTIGAKEIMIADVATTLTVRQVNELCISGRKTEMTFEDLGFNATTYSTGQNLNLNFSNPYTESSGVINLHNTPESCMEADIRINNAFMGKEWFTTIGWRHISIPTGVMDQGINTLKIGEFRQGGSGCSRVPVTILEDSTITLNESLGCHSSENLGAITIFYDEDNEFGNGNEIELIEDQEWVTIANEATLMNKGDKIYLTIRADGYGPANLQGYWRIPVEINATAV